MSDPKRFQADVEQEFMAQAPRVYPDETLHPDGIDQIRAFVERIVDWELATLRSSIDGRRMCNEPTEKWRCISDYGHEGTCR